MGRQDGGGARSLIALAARLPGLRFVQALASSMGRGRQAAPSELAQSQIMRTLDGMSWPEFALLLGDAFQARGYTLHEEGNSGAGLALRRGKETYLLAYKPSKAARVGVEVVRQLRDAIGARRAAGGFVITAGRFTSEAQVFARGERVELVDGTRLVRMLEEAQAARSAETMPAPLSARPAGATKRASGKGRAAR